MTNQPVKDMTDERADFDIENAQPSDQSARVADELSVQDIRVGMAALIQCDVSEITNLDNREYDENYQAVQRIVEAITLNVK